MNQSWITLLALTGCGVSNSSSLLTSGISPVMTAQAAGTGSTSVFASLYEGHPGQLIFVDLQGNDMLIASHGSQSVTLDKTQVLTVISYGASLATDNEGDQITFDLSRTVDAGAPSSIATMPAKFTLGTIPTSSSRAASLPVTWSPSGTSDAMSWQAAGDCIDVASGGFGGDPGSGTIPASSLVKRMGQGVADSCTVTLTVFRARPGTLDSHFESDGSIVAQQVRSATFTTMP